MSNPGNGATSNGEGSSSSVLTEAMQLEFLKEIGQTHMRILDGLTSLLQLTGLLARLVKISGKLDSGSAAVTSFKVTI